MRDFRGGSIRTGGLIGISLLALAAAEPVFAQTTEGASTGSPIIVTATRRAEGVQDTPLAVAVTSGETLENYSISSFQDLTRIEPSLVVNNQGATGNQFIIRGILSDIGSTTGFYLDEIPLSGGGAVEGNGDGRPGLRLHDVARIEVLKGPQGTLFGSGSMAGTLRIITNRPDPDQVEGGIGASLAFIEGGDSLFEGDAFINLPLASNVAARGVIWGEFGGEYIDHQVSSLVGPSSFINENVNEREVWGGRFSLLFEPAPDFTIILAAVHQEVSVDDVQSWNLDAGPYLSTSPTIASYDDNYDLYSITAEYEADYGTFTAAASYADQSVFHPEDSTPTGLGLAGAFGLEPFKTSYITSQEFEAYTGELRFASNLDGPFQFVVGAFYEHDQTDGMAVAIRADDLTGVAPCFSVEECEALGLRPSGFSAPGVPASDVIYAVGTSRTVEQWAIYGQVDFEITDGLTAIAGIRYFDASIHDFGIQIQDIAGPPDFAVPVPVPSWAANGLITTPYVTQDDRTSENSPSYNFALLYEATPDLSFFARAASGFRIGGTNNAASLANQAGVTIPDSYGSDDLWSYELGVKAYLADRRLYVDASIYQMDWSDQQLAATDPSGAFDYVLNAGKTRIRGAELQITYNDPSGLSIGGGITYTDAELRADLDPDVLMGGTIGYKGDRMPRVPRWTAAGQIAYETSIGGNIDGYVLTNFSYRGSSYYSFNDLNSFNQRLDSSFLLGAQIGVRTGGWDIGVFVHNLTDEVGVMGLDASPDGVRVYSVEPRSFGVQVRGRF